jgi:hypothetical protein
VLKIERIFTFFMTGSHSHPMSYFQKNEKRFILIALGGAADSTD